MFVTVRLKDDNDVVHEYHINKDAIDCFFAHPEGGTIIRLRSQLTLTVVTTVDELRSEVFDEPGEYRGPRRK